MSYISYLAPFPSYRGVFLVAFLHSVASIYLPRSGWMPEHWLRNLASKTRNIALSCGALRKIFWYTERYRRGSQVWQTDGRQNYDSNSEGVYTTLGLKCPMPLHRLKKNPEKWCMWFNTCRLSTAAIVLKSWTGCANAKTLETLI